MKAFILAAGLGTRLGKMTQCKPKALVSVNGETMLEHNFKVLHGAGFDNFVVNVHHFADQIIDYLEENNNFGCKVAVSSETDEPLETGGAIKKAAALLGDGLFLVHNVDIFSNLDYAAAAAEAEVDYSSGCIATLVVSSRKTERYLLFDKDGFLVGWTNIATGAVKSPYPDLDPSKCSRYAFAGIHFASSALYPLMAEWPDRFSIIDFYLSVCKEHKIKAAVRSELRLSDLGTAEKIERYIGSL